MNGSPRMPVPCMLIQPSVPTISIWASGLMKSNDIEKIDVRPPPKLRTPEVVVSTFSAGRVQLVAKARQRFGAKQQTAHVDRVASHVPQGAATRRGIEADVVGIVELLEAERHADEPGLADCAVSDEIDGARPARREPIHECFHHQLAGLLRRAFDRVDLGQRQSKRLLAENMLARPQRLHCPFGMEVVRQRDIDRVDIAVGEKRVVGAIGALRAPSDAVGFGRLGCDGSRRPQDARFRRPEFRGSRGC